MKFLERVCVFCLRPVLAVFMLILLMLQTLSFPGQFRHMAHESPQDAHLRWPLTIIVGAVLLSLELIVLSLWKLLTLVKEKTILTHASQKWMNLMIFGISLTWAIMFPIACFILWNADDPGAPVMFIFMQILVTVIGMTAIVVRGVFMDAAALQTSNTAV